MLKKRLSIAIALLTLANTSMADMHIEPLPSDYYSSFQNTPTFDTGRSRSTQGFGSPSSTMVTVQFDNRSTVFKPSLDDVSILADAQNAALITVRGRTSTPTPSAKDEMLGLARALSARKYLIEHGVSPLKISVNWASAADFIADNETPEGKLLNQRVEIELVYVMQPAN